MNGTLLEIEPRELKFVFELRRQSSCSVQLTNNSNHCVAFKVKTTSPKRYCVRPNAGIVMSKSILHFTVTLQAQKVAPADLQCKDKFLVQSTVVPHGTTDEDIKPDFFMKETGRLIEENKLRVVFVGPPHSLMMQCVNGSSKEPPEHSPKLQRHFMSFKEPAFESSFSRGTPAVDPFAKEAPDLKAARLANETSILRTAHIAEEHVPETPVNAKEASDLKESFVLNESLVQKEIKAQKDAVPSIKKEASESKESFQSESLVEEEIPAEKHSALLDHQEPAGILHAGSSEVEKGVQELTLKLNNLESRLHETEIANDKLREENSLVLKENDKLHREIIMLRRKCVAANVHVGFPFLFVCFVGFVGILLGYSLHR